MATQKKVFVLVTDSMVRGEQEISVKTFDTKQKAEKEMKARYLAEINDWNSWCDEHCIEVEETENSRSIWESGEYHENHIEFTIHEQEVL